MPKRKLPYTAGDWFAVPLENGGYALGKVARMDGKGGVLGYFFGPKYAELPAPEATKGRSAQGAILISQFGDLGFLEGSWKVVAKDENWRPELWPVPDFAHIDAIMGVPYKRIYSEDLELIETVRCSRDEAKKLPEDGSAGSGWIEECLTDLLAEQLDGRD